MRSMADVDSLQNSEEAVAQQRQEAAEKAREAALEQLRKAPLADTALKAQRRVEAKLDQVRSSSNMREGPLPEVEELAISLLETGLLHPPLVRETGDDATPTSWSPASAASPRCGSSTRPRASRARGRSTCASG